MSPLESELRDPQAARGPRVEYLILSFGHHYATPGDASTQVWRFQAWVDGVVVQEWTFPAGGSLNLPHVSSVLSELGGLGWCLAANDDFKTFSNGNFVFTRQQVPVKSVAVVYDGDPSRSLVSG